MESYGARLAWCADNDSHVAKILETRFPVAPNFGDLTAVDWAAVPRVDIVTAGFPCQDISYAGRGAGMTKETRSGLWFAIAKALRVLRPGLVILENVAALRSRGLDRVLGDLAALGYDTAWTCVRASDVGAPHRRERLFLLATHPDSSRPLRRGGRCGTESRRPCSEPSRRGVRVSSADSGRLQPERWGNGGVLAQPPKPSATSPSTPVGHRDQAHPFSGIGSGEGSKADGLRWRHWTTDTYRRAAELGPAGRQPDWGPYGAAVRRWEAASDRPAPDPTELGTRGQPRLSARFVEWMMGLSDGWVTNIDLPRTAHMHALGNGVVPQQATHALALLDAISGGRSRAGNG
ncbi:DNA cytosine methyltransferase [Streptosporangium sp. KLBMP 9127]|nr:DNA cytosine methyltransferase [Streptosporangium sp. KLBMP 9127]